MGAALFTQPSQASSELDRVYLLERVGFLPSSDNMDGLFTGYVAQAYEAYFAKQSRFIAQDLSKTDAILNKTKLNLDKILHDTTILSQISRSTRADSLFRTKVTKDGNIYHFYIDWLQSPKIDLIATEEFTLTAGNDLSGETIKSAFQQALDKLIGKLPFLGHVTGRDHNSVTVNIGTNLKLKKGDILYISTLNEVKKHPLLKQIVSWNFIPSGKVEVEAAEDKMAFCKILEEKPGLQINRFQKVTEILPKQENTMIIEENPEKSRNEENDLPKLGWAGVNFGLGQFSRQYTYNTGGGRNGSGLALEPQAEAQIWLTRDWAVDLGLGFDSWGYSQTSISTGDPDPNLKGASGGLFSLRLAAGYTYLLQGEFFGPKGLFKIGYCSNSYSLPVSSDGSTAPVTFSSVFLGLSGDLPVRPRWSATLSFDYGLVNSAAENGGLSGGMTGASYARFYMGALYYYQPRIVAKLGIELIGQGASYSSGAALSQKLISIIPSVEYLF